MYVPLIYTTAPAGPGLGAYRGSDHGGLVVLVPRRRRGLGASNRNNCFTMEMNATGGQAWFINLDGPSTDQLSVGDRWEFHIQGGPQNTPVFHVNDDSSALPLGSTDGGGNFVMSGQATSDQIGVGYRRAINTLFPNSVGGFDKSNPTYQDPNAPAGFRRVLICIVAFDVVPQGSIPSTGPMMPNAPIPQAAMPTPVATAIAAAAGPTASTPPPTSVVQPLPQVVAQPAALLPVTSSPAASSPAAAVGGLSTTTWVWIAVGAAVLGIGLFGGRR